MGTELKEITVRGERHLVEVTMCPPGYADGVEHGEMTVSGAGWQTLNTGCYRRKRLLAFGQSKPLYTGGGGGNAR